MLIIFPTGHATSSMARPIPRSLVSFMCELRTFLLHGEPFLTDQFGVEVNDRLQVRRLTAKPLPRRVSSSPRMLWKLCCAVSRRFQPHTHKRICVNVSQRFVKELQTETIYTVVVVDKYQARIPGRSFVRTLPPVRQRPSALPQQRTD